MLENTKENKKKFMLQYYGQEVLNTQGDTLSKVGSNNWNLGHKNFFLELTPLSKITDEDAIEVAKIWGNKTESRIIGHSIVSRITSMDSTILTETRNMLGVIDYLRSKSYLIPYNGTPTETLIEYGWAVIKN